MTITASENSKAPFKRAVTTVELSPTQEYIKTQALRFKDAGCNAVIYSLNKHLINRDWHPKEYSLIGLTGSSEKIAAYFHGMQDNGTTKINPLALLNLAVPFENQGFFLPMNAENNLLNDPYINHTYQQSIKNFDLDAYNALRRPAQGAMQAKEMYLHELPHISQQQKKREENLTL